MERNCEPSRTLVPQNATRRVPVWGARRQPRCLELGFCNMVLARWRVKNASLTAWRGRDQRPPLTPGSLGLTSSLEMSRPDRTIILDARALSRALQRMAVEVLELARGTDRLVLIGIQRRGVELAERIAGLIEKDEGVVLPRGALDITLYRDDPPTGRPHPAIRPTRSPRPPPRPPA